MSGRIIYRPVSIDFARKNGKVFVDIEDVQKFVQTMAEDTYKAGKKNVAQVIVHVAKRLGEVEFK